MKSLCRKFFVIPILVFFYSTSYGNELYDTEHQVVLSGTLEEKQYCNANDNQEKIIILKTDSIINVKEDDFGGPANEVNEIQLSPYKEIYKTKINQKVLVTGKLFYPINDHQHTKILIDVKNLNFTKKD